MITHFDHVGLYVRDLDEAIKFFTELFGFGIRQRWNHPRQAFVGRGAAVLGLIEQKDYDDRRPMASHIAFPCAREDFPDYVAKLAQLGAEIVSGPQPQRNGESVLFRDPSGNIFEICYPPFRN
jgi:catechol 2,3-dioxygenase-like lactoylglutathione lyase family enzyme